MVLCSSDTSFWFFPVRCNHHLTALSLARPRVGRETDRRTDRPGVLAAVRKQRDRTTRERRAYKCCAPSSGGHASRLTWLRSPAAAPLLTAIAWGAGFTSGSLAGGGGHDGPARSKPQRHQQLLANTVRRLTLRPPFDHPTAFLSSMWCPPGSLARGPAASTQGGIGLSALSRRRVLRIGPLTGPAGPRIHPPISGQGGWLIRAVSGPFRPRSD